MALRTRVQISKDNQPADVDDQYLRRAYDVDVLKTLSLTTTKVEVGKDLSSIQYIYVKRTGNDADVYVYRNAGPDAYIVDDVFLAIGIENCDRLALKASAATEVTVYLGGS